MKISPNDTIRKVIIKNGTLFGIGNKRIYESIAALPKPDYVKEKRRIFGWKKHEARSVAGITMGELNAIERIEATDDYFVKVLAVMLGLISPKGKGSKRIDWEGAGYNIAREKVLELQFIRAYRYFIEIQNELKGVAKAWKKLEMPLTPQEANAQVQRKNRGMSTICLGYCQLVGGAIQPSDVWHLRWSTVYLAYEAERDKNMAQRKLAQMNKPKPSKSRRR